jgi:hypothetical protein
VLLLVGCPLPKLLEGRIYFLQTCIVGGSGKAVAL